MARTLAGLIALALLMVNHASAQDLLQNASFEDLDGAAPKSWQAADWRTGGKCAVVTGDAAEGRRYVGLSATDEKQRAGWRQDVPFTGAIAVFEGNMRTRGVREQKDKGASVRLCFRDEKREIALSQAFFPPSEKWDRVRHVFPVPAGTKTIGVELLHWFTPGETDWDDVSLRTGGEKEMADFIRQNLDAKPGPTQKPYHPADGQVVEVTPPAFIWVPVGGSAVYALQVSRSEKFPDADTRTFSGLKRSVFVPREPLPAGKWFWRYGVETAGGAVYGRSRPFTIPESARPFPFPDFNQVVQRIPRQHPRLYFPGDRLARIRELAKTDLKPVIEKLVASCQKAVDEPLVPEPSYQPKGPERGPWAVNVMQTTRPPMDMMERCALAYLLTGDRRLGLEAKRRLLHFFSWDPQGPTSLFAYDEPPMWVMMRGSRAYDWTYDLFTPEERAKIEPNMKARALQFLKLLQSMPFEANPYSSHPGRLPGFLGECAISFIHEWPEAKEWLEYVTLLYYTSYPAWGGEDGGWQEGPGYWGAYMSFALHFVIALREAAGVDLMQKPFFRNTAYYGLYTATPYHEHMPFGDGQSNRPAPLGFLMCVFSTLTQNPYFRWHAEAAGRTVEGDVLCLSTYDPSLKARSPLELPQARCFPGAGLVSIHTALGNKDEDISFLLRSSPYGSVSHGHADQNAFVIEAFGKGLAIATGYYPWYGSPHHQDWTRATRAVNSVLVNGEGQERRSWDASGAITAFIHGDGYDYAEGEAATAYGGRLKKFRRHVVHIRPGVFVIFDDLESQKPSTFQWLLHAYDKIKVDDQGRKLRIERAPAAMDVRLLLPEAITFLQTDKYDPEPERLKGRGEMQNTWHLTASTIQPSTSAQFLSVLMPHRLGAESKLPKIELVPGKGALGVRLTTPDGFEDLVAFRTGPDAKTAESASLRSDARVFARGRAADGAVLRHLLLEGASLSEGNKVIK